MPVELELAEEAAEQVADLARRGVQRGQHRRRHLAHLVGGRRRGDDLGAVDELVAVAVVAVGVGVDHRADRRRARVVGHRLQHRLREAEVEQRVDEQRRPVTDDEPGVAPAPPAIALEVGEAPVAELTELTGRPITEADPSPSH